MARRGVTMFLRPSVVLALVALIVFSPVAAAQSGHGHDHGATWGAVAGDPRILEDGAACFAAAMEHSGTKCAVLYAHMFDLLNDFLMNVQPPPECAPDLEQGFAGVVPHEEYWNLNQLDAYSSPGFVEYNVAKDLCNDPRLHQEPGITSDVHIDTRIPILGYWYLSADFDEAGSIDDANDIAPGTAEGPDAGTMPCLTVRMTLQTGRHWQEGTALAVGETTKTVLSAAVAGEGPEDPLAAQVPCPGGRQGDVVHPEQVTEFEVVMEPLSDQVHIPKDEGFIVHVEWYTHAPGDPDEQDKLYMGQYNLRTGAAFANRIVLPIADVVRFDSFRAVEFDEKVYLQVVANSPWGSYDIDPASLTISLLDPSGNEVPLDHLEDAILQYSVDHDGHFDPLKAAIPWDVDAEELEPGVHTIVATVQNFQHTATARAETSIVISPKGHELPPDPEELPKAEPPREKKAPAPAFASVLAALALAAVPTIRRTRPKKP